MCWRTATRSTDARRAMRSCRSSSTPPATGSSAGGRTALTATDRADIGSVYAPFAPSTPLWYYILAESKIAAGGLNLGPVAARIVPETLIGLLRADPTSYLRAYRRFTPFL